MENVFVSWENHFTDGKLRPRGGHLPEVTSEVNGLAQTRSSGIC